MSLGVYVGRQLQGAVNLLPGRGRLPVRFAAHRVLGGLEPEIRLLPQLVAKDRIALDIGANMGVYTYALAPLARHIHAFEPQPDCCETIEAWAEGRNVTVHRAAVGASQGKLPLQIPLKAGRAVTTRASFEAVDGPCTTIEVPVLRIDDLGTGPVGFIKIDVEGFERDVIEGAHATLRRDRPVLLIEIDRARHNRQSFDAIIGSLAALDYGPHAVLDGVLTPCPDPAWATASKVYNFIFFRPGDVVR